MERPNETGGSAERDEIESDGTHLDVDRRRLLKAGIVTAGAVAAGSVPGTAAARSTDWNDLTLKEQLNVVREATNAYKRFDAMDEAGYASIPLQLLCGMGYHFDNLDNWDGTLDPRNPESLFYVLNEAGRLKLGEAELILPTELDGEGNPVEPRPDIFNDEAEPLDGEPLRGTSEEDGWVLFTEAEVALWTLHVWVHERNPEGVFHPQNPRYEEMPGCSSLE